MKISKIVIAFLLMALFLTACSGAVANLSDKEYVLTTEMKDGKLVFLGVSDEINAQINPILSAEPGESITVTLINGGMGQHSISFPAIKTSTDVVKQKGEAVSVTFAVPNKDVTLEYIDGIGNNAAMGMIGVLKVGEGTPEVAAAVAIQPTGNTVSYTLETGLQDGKMAFIGKDGDIAGMTNPDLKANVGDKVVVTLFSGEGAEHDFTLDQLGLHTDHVVGKGNSVKLEFVADREGTFAYFCSLPGHRQAGMEGKFIIGSGMASVDQNVSHTTMEATPAPVLAPAGTDVVNVVRDPTDLPAPIGNRAPTTVSIDLEAVEVTGQLADGTTFPYWTFNGKVPGPFFRVRVGDTVEVHLKNSPSSTMAHSVDFHAVTGPGGGAVFTTVTPGQESMFTFKALVPGLYVYHCATPMVAEHIANGMYGMILVEPEGGLPKVDREFYVMQGEIYTSGKFGDQGLMQPDTDKLLNETPDYYVLNGEVGALTTKHPLKANVGETVRIFFGVGGPNKTSSFHAIGEIFDKVYNLGSVTTPPMTDVQTTLVPPGGATIVEIQLQVPGRYILVDHALARLQRGLAGYLVVDGPAAPEIFDGTPMPGSGH